MSTQNRVAQKVWKNSTDQERLNYFHFSRGCLFAAGISIGSVFWFHWIGVHVKLTLLLSALRWAQNRVTQKVWKNSPYRGRLNQIFSFFEGLSFGCWHFDWFSILISRNWRARQAHSFNFGITLSTEQGYPKRLAGEVELFSFFRGAVFWLLAFGLVQYFDFTELACPDGRAPTPYTSKLTGIDEIMKVNQQSATDMQIAVQYVSGWNFSGWVVGVGKGNCNHYKLWVRIYVHVHVESMKWCYLTHRIKFFEDSIWYVHLTHSISMMMLMRRHTKDGYGSAFSLKTRQIDLTNYVFWIPQSMSWINHVHGA